MQCRISTSIYNHPACILNKSPNANITALLQPFPLADIKRNKCHVGASFTFSSDVRIFGDFILEFSCFSLSVFWLPLALLVLPFFCAESLTSSSNACISLCSSSLRSAYKKIRFNSIRVERSGIDQYKTYLPT